MWGDVEGWSSLIEKRGGYGIEGAWLWWDLAFRGGTHEEKSE